MKKWKFLLPAAGIVAIGAIAASIYCSQTEYGNEYIIDQQGNKVVEQGFKDVYYEWDCPEKKAQYMISNRWPKWSPFYKEKWGFINLETKTVEAPRFSDKLRYRDDGLAWDYKGHLIDKDGNIVVNCKWYFEDGRFLDNPRKFALYALKRRILNGHILNGGFLGYGIFDKNQTLQSYDTLSNRNNKPYIGIYDSYGLTSYYSYSDSAYGYMDMEGNTVIPPKYGMATGFDENGFASAYNNAPFENNGYGLINTKGEVVVDFDYEGIVKDYGDLGYVLEGYRTDSYADKEGNILLDSYRRIITLGGKYIAAKEKTDDAYVYMDSKCQPFLESEYKPCGYDSKKDLFIVEIKEDTQKYMDHDGNILDDIVSPIENSYNDDGIDDVDHFERKANTIKFLDGTELTSSDFKILTYYDGKDASDVYCIVEYGED